MRANFGSLRLGDLPEAIGLCAADTPRLLRAVSAATHRLLIAGGESGFWGSFDRIAFNVTQGNPYLITPANVARVINLTSCSRGIAIRNGFFELLQYGVGLRGPDCCGNSCVPTQIYDRGTQPFLTDMTTGSVLRIFPTNAADVGKRIFFNGIDTNGIPVSSIDNGVTVPGVFVTLALPYVDTPLAFNVINSVQKDLTLAMVSVYQINADTTLSLLAQYPANQQFPSYRKYFVGNLPTNCCNTATLGMVQMEAMCKIDFQKYTSDMDDLLLANEQALIEECQSLRYSKMDDGTAKAEAALHHRTAIRLLNQELDHYLGKDSMAVNISYFGGNASDAAYRNLGRLV
jgi:hypothetical protein